MNYTKTGKSRNTLACNRFMNINYFSVFSTVADWINNNVNTYRMRVLKYMVNYWPTSYPIIRYRDRCLSFWTAMMMRENNNYVSSDLSYKHAGVVLNINIRGRPFGRWIISITFTIITECMHQVVLHIHWLIDRSHVP